MSEFKRNEGWGFPMLSKRFHYFVGGRSLCGKWAFFGELEPDLGLGIGAEDCRDCAKRFQRNQKDQPK